MTRGEQQPPFLAPVRYTLGAALASGAHLLAAGLNCARTCVEGHQRCTRATRRHVGLREHLGQVIKASGGGG